MELANQFLPMFVMLAKCYFESHCHCYLMPGYKLNYKNYKKIPLNAFSNLKTNCWENRKCATNVCNEEGALTWHWQGGNVPCFSLKQMYWHDDTSCKLPYLRRLDWPRT